MNNTQKQLAQAAFLKMIEGEPLSIQDAQRVWEIVLNTGLNIDTGNKQAVDQFVGGQLKPALHQRFFAQ